MTTRFIARVTTTRVGALLGGASLMLLAAACAKKDATTDTTAAATNAASATTTSSGPGASTAGASTAGASTAGASTAGAMTASQRQDVNDAIRGYRLIEDNVNKVIDATQKMRALQKSNPQVAAAMNQEHGDANDAKSIDEAAARLDALPPVKGVLSSVGISSRDYLLTTFALMEAGAAYQFQKAGKLPPNSELAKDVSPENLAYIGAHQAQLQALEKANGNGEGE